MSLYAISTGQFDGWVESCEIDAPKVAAVLVWGVRVGGRLVGAVDEVMVVAAESGVLDLEGAGGEPFDAGIAFGMDLIEVDPAVGLTVELDGGVGGEEEAGGSVGEVGKNAAGLVGWRRVVPVARSASWMDQGLGEMRAGANSRVGTKGECSQASWLLSGENAGAESLLVEGSGKLRVWASRS